MREVAVSPQMGANRMQWSYKRQESVKKKKKKTKIYKKPYKSKTFPHIHKEEITSINLVAYCQLYLPA